MKDCATEVGEPLKSGVAEMRESIKLRAAKISASGEGNAAEVGVAFKAGIIEKRGGEWQIAFVDECGVCIA